MDCLVAGSLAIQDATAYSIEGTLNVRKEVKFIVESKDIHGLKLRSNGIW